jgi:hypothetical protein
LKAYKLGTFFIPMKFNRRCWSFIAVALFATVMKPASAQLVFDNIGGPVPFERLSALGLGDYSTVPATFATEAAVQFTVNSTVFLDHVDIELWFPQATINVALLANTAGNTPGAVLETTTVTSPASAPMQFFPLSRAEFSDLTLLSAGVKYWLALSPPAGTFGSWEYSLNALGLVVTDTNSRGFDDPWGAPVTDRQGGIRVYGVSAVPEASTYGLFGSGFIVFLAVFRRRSKSV